MEGSETFRHALGYCPVVLSILLHPHLLVQAAGSCAPCERSSSGNLLTCSRLIQEKGTGVSDQTNAYTDATPLPSRDACHCSISVFANHCVLNMPQTLPCIHNSRICIWNAFMVMFMVEILLPSMLWATRNVRARLSCKAVDFRAACRNESNVDFISQLHSCQRPTSSTTI